MGIGICKGMGWGWVLLLTSLVIDLSLFLLFELKKAEGSIKDLDLVAMLLTWSSCLGPESLHACHDALGCDIFDCTYGVPSGFTTLKAAPMGVTGVLAYVA